MTLAKRAATRNNRSSRQERAPRSNHRSRKDNVIELDIPTKKRSKEVHILPKNIEQEALIESLSDKRKHIVFAVGPAGTGKTHVATTMAIKALKAGEIEKIVVTRPNIAVDDKDIGFLPGDIIAKLAPWCQPVLDVFNEYFSKMEIEKMLEEGIIELVPIAYIRGRTFKKAWVIFDEAQNSTVRSMLSVLTRIGEGSKLIITGDERQGDRGKDNGLSDFLTRFENSRSIDVVKFSYKNVERHPVIKEILELYKDVDI